MKYRRWIVLALLSCAEDPTYVPTSCHWRAQGYKARDEMQDADQAVARQAAIRMLVYYDMYVIARQHELAQRLDIQCEKTEEEP